MSLATHLYTVQRSKMHRPLSFLGIFPDLRKCVFSFHYLTSQNRINFEKVTVIRLVKKFSIRKFIDLSQHVNLRVVRNVKAPQIIFDTVTSSSSRTHCCWPIPLVRSFKTDFAIYFLVFPHSSPLK